MTARIAENASIDSLAEIDEDVEIGPFCVIGPGARIRSGSRLLNHAATELAVARVGAIHEGSFPLDVAIAHKHYRLVDILLRNVEASVQC